LVRDASAPIACRPRSAALGSNGHIVRARAKKRTLSTADIMPKPTATAREPSKKGRSAGAARAILKTTPVRTSLASVIARLHGDQINEII